MLRRHEAEEEARHRIQLAVVHHDSDGRLSRRELDIDRDGKRSPSSSSKPSTTTRIGDSPRRASRSSAGASRQYPLERAHIAEGAHTTGTCAYCRSEWRARCLQSTAAVAADVAALDALPACAETRAGSPRAMAAPPAAQRPDVHHAAARRVLPCQEHHHDHRGYGRRDSCRYGVWRMS